MNAAMNQLNALYGEMTASLSRAIAAAIVGLLLLAAGIAVFLV
jgi:hypothetical protein